MSIALFGKIHVGLLFLLYCEYLLYYTEFKTHCHWHDGLDTCNIFVVDEGVHADNCEKLGRLKI